MKGIDKNEDSNREHLESSRRDFLKTAGKIAVYTPPVMLAISSPSHATFSKSSGVNVRDARSRRSALRRNWRRHSFFSRFFRH